MKTKGRRQSKNVEVRKHTPKFDPLKDELFGVPSKEQQAEANHQRLEDNAHFSPHLRHRGHIKNKKPDPLDDELNTFRNLSIEADPVGATKTLRQLREGKEPQKKLDRTRIQVTPGKWNTK